MTDLADHIRDAQDNLKAGITKIRQRQGFNYLTDIPDEFNKAAHALSYAAKAVEQAADAKAEPLRESASEMVLHPLSEVRDLDDVVRELGIESSPTTPAEAVRELKEEIERFRVAPPAVDKSAGIWRNQLMRGCDTCAVYDEHGEVVVYVDAHEPAKNIAIGNSIAADHDPSVAVDRAAVIEECMKVALEQRCERGTPWDRACVTIAEKIRCLADAKGDGTMGEPKP
jgi:hypothetical protein